LTLTVLIFSAITVHCKSKIIDQAKTIDQANVSNVPSVGWTASLVTYGLVHMARSGGSAINRIFALKYERVCGNKGYSYNAYEINERKRLTPPLNYTDIQITTKIMTRHVNKTGKKIKEDAYKVGFDDCDYIAMEQKAGMWQEHMGNLHRPLELHVPCRDPIDHLMSMCAFNHREFRCNVSNKELQKQVNACTNNFLGRFSIDMALSPNFTMKCFSSPSKIDDYIEYMGETLQKRRIQGEYFDITSNKFERHKETECIWEKVNEGVRRKLEEMIINHHEYFKYCKNCIGSENDLLR